MNRLPADDSYVISSLFGVNTAANFWDIGLIFHVNCLLEDDSHVISALFGFLKPRQNLKMLSASIFWWCFKE